MSPAGPRLVVRAPGRVGDLVMATPVLAAAAADARFDEVRFLVPRHLTPLLQDAPWAERVVPLASSREEPARYRELAPDVALLLSGSFGAALRAWRARVPVRAGSALSGRRWLLTHAFVPPGRFGRRLPTPTAHLHRDAAGLIGIHPESMAPRLWAGEALRDRVAAELEERGLGRGEPYVLCTPGAAFGSGELWPPARFAEVADHLHATRGWRTVVSGGPGEEPSIRALAEACSHPAIDLSEAPRDLERLKALVRGARLVLVGGSGPRWVAAAFGVPCVSVMGPDFPERTATSLEHARIVRLEGLPCAPCLQRTCPLGHHRCLRDLPAARAIEACEALLAGEGGEA
jgi:heptosyltransferase-2